MDQNIIKNIILKFKGDTTELKKEAKAVEDVLKKINASDSGGQGKNSVHGKLAKNIQDIGKNLEKAGIPLERSFKRMQESIKRLANEDLKNVASRLETLQRQTAKAHDRLQQARNSNSPMTDIRQAAFDRMQQRTADMASNAGNLPPSAMNRGMNALGGIGGVMALAGQGIGIASNLYADQQANRAAAASYGIGKRMDFYGGNLNSILMNNKYGTTQKSIIEGRRKAEGGAIGSALTMGGSAALGYGALGTIGAMMAGTAAAPVALPALAIGGAVAGGKYLYDRYTGKIDANAANNAQAIEGSLNQQGLDPIAYEKFRAGIGHNRRMNNLFGMDDATALANRTGFLGNQVSFEEGQGIAASMRGRLGSVKAMQAAQMGSGLYREFGTDAATAAEFAGSALRNTSGGSDRAKQQLIDSQAKAMAAGIEDSGLTDLLQRYLSAIQDSATGTTSRADIMDRIAGSVGGDTSIRGIAGAISADEAITSRSMQGGLTYGQRLRKSKAVVDQMTGLDPGERQQMLVNLASMNPNDINSENSFLQGIGKNMPGGSFDWDSFGKDSRKTMSLTTTQSNAISNYSKEVAANGFASSDTETRAMSALKYLDPSATNESLKAQLGQYASTGEMLGTEAGRNALTMRGQRQRQGGDEVHDIATTQGAIQEQELIEKTRQRKTEFAEAAKAQGQGTAGVEELSPDASMGKFSKSVDDFSSALSTLANKMNNVRLGR